MNSSDMLFVGASGYVAAFNKHDGTELWRATLKSGMTLAGDRFVTVLVEGERVYAHTYGHLFCLDAQTGEQLWTNELSGLGYDLATLALEGTSSPPPAELAKRRRERASDSGNAGRGTA
jgi:outer membrane protein assembly factor BamB